MSVSEVVGTQAWDDASGENLYVMENHAPIIQHAVTKFHLSTKVTRIETIGDDPKDPKVLVRTENSTFEFDEVVVAVSLWCLQHSQLDFSPPLPDRIQTAISNASYSSLEKVYITFSTAFWDGPNPNPTSSDEPSTAFPAFAHFHNSEPYVPEYRRHWSIEMLPLFSPRVFGPHAKLTLLIYTHDLLAEHVRFLIRGLDPDSEAYYNALNTFFKPYYSRLPHYVGSSPGCVPSGFLATDWHGDDLAGNRWYTNFQASSRESFEEGEGEWIRLDVERFTEGTELMGAAEVQLQSDLIR